MPRLRFDSFVLIALSVSLWAVLYFFPADTGLSRSLEEIKRSGTLVVLTQNNPTTYYLDKDGEPTGPDYRLIHAFAKSIDVDVHFQVIDSLAALLNALEAGEGDLAAAGLSITEERRRRFLFSKPYQRVSQQVVCRRGGPRPRGVADLMDVGLAVIAGSSYEERLQSLRADFPELSWEATEGVSAEQLLERVWRKDLDCTVLDSNIVAINRRYYPELKVRFELSNQDDLAWMLPKGARKLRGLANDWLESYEASKKIAAIQELYYGHVELFDYVDTSAFVRRLSSLYPRYQPFFKEAAAQYGFSESLLAAQAYQESHWNPYAKSPTGVRGIMMLTQVTAKAMGVERRTDAQQSIFGGAKYLARLKKRLSRHVEEPDLTWLALAAYNVGMGHLRDAQKLAKHFGGNPYRWHDVKESLPLLSDPKYYKFMKYGYARGSEPVLYVQQVRQYQHIMQQHLQSDAASQELETVASDEEAVEPTTL